MEWTPEQLNAIEHTGSAAIVSAAAGSGKTAVLVERVIRLITDKNKNINADKMVIATFTEKAAAEMKQRLDSALETALETCSEENAGYLHRQQLALEDASISTISSFCLGILRKNIAMLENVSPNFTIIDDTEADILLKRAISEALDIFCETEPENKVKLLYDWYAYDGDGKLEDMLEDIYKFSRNLIDAEGYFSKQLDIYENPEHHVSEVAEKFYEHNIKQDINKFSSLCSLFRNEVDRLGEELEKGTITSKAYEKFLIKRTEWESIAEIWKNLDYDNCKEKAETFKKLGKRTNMPQGFKETYIGELNEKLGKLVKTDGIPYKAELMLSMTDDIKKCAAALDIIVSLYNLVDDRYSEFKKERNKLDFSDIESNTIKLLRNSDGTPSALAREIADETEVIIVDEFQDSNELQYEIFRLISRDKKNLYFVGDIKQSIYHFRGADPLVFANLTKDTDFTVLNLNRNFRSSDEVIDAVNGIFTGLMTVETGDVDYDDSCKLIKGAGYEKNENNKTELITFKQKKSDDARRIEASYLADRIQRMVDEKYQVSNGRDPEITRPCSYGDFAILLESFSNNVHFYTKALEKAGIPYDAKSKTAYTDYSEVRAVISFLKLIDNPYNDKSLLTIMMRPPYMFTADEITELKLINKKDKLWPNLKKYAAVNKKAADFLDEINEFRSFAGENSTEQLLRKIYDESRIIPSLLASYGSEKRDANIRKLINYSVQFTDEGGGSLYDFLRYMELIERKGIKMGEDGSSSGNAVHIMSIHASKGLEFPVCIVANTASGSSPDKDYGISLDPTLGIGICAVEKKNLLKIVTAYYELTKKENIRLKTSEKLRLLYVAATRAKQKLIFTAAIGKRGPALTFYDWIIDSNAVCDGLITTSDCSEYKALEKNNYSENIKTLPLIKDFSDYRYAAFSAVPAKVTATQIGVKSVDDFSDYSEDVSRFLRVPSFIRRDETSKLSGKKRGDAYHKAMELLDFSKEPASAKKQLDVINANGKISDIERFSINDADIETFLESDLCRRAAKADKNGDLFREYPIFCECEPSEKEFFGITDWPENEDKPFVQGIADMFFIEDDEIVLVDYKTNVNITEQKLVEEYKGQLEIYKKALEEIMDRKVKECLLYSFFLGKQIRTDVT